MAVAWYGVRVWTLTSPDGCTKVIGTRPTHSWCWETWTVTKDDGCTKSVPQNAHLKYMGLRFSLAYDSETDPTVALMRVEYPDTEQPPLDEGDVIALLDTQAKWNNAMNQYPTLRYRFPDQPYYPSTG